MSVFKSIISIFLMLVILSGCSGDSSSENRYIYSQSAPPTVYQPCASDTTGLTEAEIDSFQIDEYYESSYDKTNNAYTSRNKALLANICGASAYARIKKMAALAGSTAQQAGLGQIVSVMGTRFNTSHTEFYLSGTSTAFDSVFDASTGALYSSYADIVDPTKGNCRSDLGCADKHGTHNAGIIAARKTGYRMHGVAYRATLKGVITEGYNLSMQQKIAAIQAGSGSNIVAMNNSAVTELVASCIDYRGAKYYYNRPAGLNIVSPDSCIQTKTTTRLAAQEVTAWGNAVDSGTIIVFPNGDDGLNSVTGMMATYDSLANLQLSNNPTMVATNSLFAKGDKSVNRAGFMGSYPALYSNDALTAGRWLTVIAVDRNAVITSSSNGCGLAKNFCLAAPGVTVYSAIEEDATDWKYETYSGTDKAAPHVSGALAVLQATFPSLTPEQLVALVLETATDLGVEGVDDVYGHGLLNLNAATMPVGATSAVGFDNVALGANMLDTRLMLANHFGNDVSNIKLGMRDKYNRTFATEPEQSTYAPVAIGLDDYMAGLHVGLLGDDVQSDILSPQAQLNYKNGAGGNNWMNLQYSHGKAVAKISFQDNYKIKPLTDASSVTILRANNIRPASSNIGMMDVDYKLGKNLTLSSYAARGEYDTGYRFDELGTDIDWYYKKSTLNLGLGHLREHEQFLGANTMGAYALSEPSISQFTDVTYGRDLGETSRFNIYANYVIYKTDVNMGYQQFASIDGLQADQYKIGFKGKNILSDDDGLDIALITKLGVTDGALTQHTVLGYTDDGHYRNVTQSYDLAVQERHQQLEVTYQGRLYQHSQDKVSVLKDNRFFTTIRVDQNLNHEEGVGQVEVIGGVSTRF